MIDTSGMDEDVTLHYRFRLRPTADGVSVQTRQGRRTETSACTREGRADMHPREGEEELFSCGEFGLLAIRAADATLCWAGLTGEMVDGWERVQLGDLTGDGRAEIILSGSYEFSPTEGMAWQLRVQAMEDSGPRAVYDFSDVDARIEGLRPEHTVEIRGPDGEQPPSLVHTQVDAGSGTREVDVLRYDPARRELVERADPVPSQAAPAPAAGD